MFVQKSAADLCHSIDDNVNGTFLIEGISLASNSELHSMQNVAWMSAQCDFFSWGSE